MKKLKYGLAIVLFTIGFIFTGELSMYYLDNFQEGYYGASFYFENAEMGNDEIIHDFTNCANKNQVDFFTIDFTIDSDYKKTIKVYGTKGALYYLASHEIKEKRYNSLFSGYADVFLTDISKCETIKQQEFFYFTGNDIGAIHNFKEELVDQYGGEFPQLYGSVKNTIVSVGTVWGIIFSVILLLAVYDITLQRKEFTLLIILGYNLKTVFLKNILKDLVTFLGEFLLIPFLLCRWSNTFFFFRVLVIFFILFLVLNICVNLLIFRVNIKQNFSNVKENKGILKINYIIKTATLLLVSFVLSINIGVISDGINFYRQKGFFDKHSEYERYQLNYKMNSPLAEMDGDVAQKFYKAFVEYSLLYADFSEQLSINYPTIVINRNSKEEMVREEKKWKEVFRGCTEKKVYIAMPEGVKGNASITSASEQICESILGYKGKKEISFYNKAMQLISFNSSVHRFKSKILRNPIIIFDNRDPELNKETASRQMYYAYDILYDIPDKEVEKFVEEYQMENEIVKITNLENAYKYNRKIVKRYIKMLLILSCIIIFLEFIMVFMIIKLEYTYHALQITLMKILGYNQLSRILRLVLITVLCSAITLILLLVYHYYKMFNAVVVSAVSIIVFTILELLIIIWRAKKIERMKVVSILKGEIV